MSNRSLSAITLFLLIATANAADPPSDKPYAFFSPSPTLDATSEPKNNATGRLTSLALRPNVEQYAYVYVYNPTPDDATVHVILSNGTRAGSEIARTAAPVVVPNKQVMKIALAGKSAPAPTTATNSADKSSSAAPSTPPGIKITDKSQLRLHVEIVTDKKQAKREAPQEFENFEIKINSPADLFNVAPSVTKSSTLQVEITPKTSDAAKFTDVPAKVRLDLRPQANPDLELEKAKGTFEADLPLDGKATLFVENVKYQTAPDKKIRKDNIQDSNSNFSVVGISIDGYERAFLLKTNFEGTPVPLTGPYANVLLSSKMQTPGKPVQVSVETNNLSGKDVKFEVDRVGDGKSFELIRNYKGTTRQNVIYLKTGGENDAIVLNPVSKDESIDFATANVIGKRSFRIEAVSKSEAQAEPIVANGELIIDKTAPYDVQLSNVPSKKELVVDSEMKLQAVGKDDESGIRKVFFYVGEAPNLDGKAVPGGKVVEGVVVDEGAKPGVPQVATFRVKEPLRLPGAKGETKIGVLYVNGVGLGTISEQTIFVTEAEVPKKKTTGSIEGRVVQGTRAQPGLPVTLSDATGKVVVKSATSDADGKFKFEELAPGTYTVAAVKKADANAKGSKTVTVEASDKPATVEINVLR